MSESQSLLSQLKAPALLEGSQLLTQVTDLKASLSYKSDGQNTSFDDHFLALQAEIDTIPSLILLKTVPTNQQDNYKMELGNSLESIEDKIERMMNKVIVFRGRLQNAQSAVADLAASFEAWYTVAASELIKDSKINLPQASIRAIATSEFNELMENSNLAVNSVLEAVKILEKQLASKKKRAREKYETGKDQANAAWARNLPQLPGYAQNRAPGALLQDAAIDDDEDDDYGDDVEANEIEAEPEPPPPPPTPKPIGELAPILPGAVSDYAKPLSITIPAGAKVTFKDTEAEVTHVILKNPMEYVIDAGPTSVTTDSGTPGEPVIVPETATTFEHPDDGTTEATSNDAKVPIGAAEVAGALGDIPTESPEPARERAGLVEVLLKEPLEHISMTVNVSPEAVEPETLDIEDEFADEFAPADEVVEVAPEPEPEPAPVAQVVEAVVDEEEPEPAPLPPTRTMPEIVPGKGMFKAGAPMEATIIGVLSTVGTFVDDELDVVAKDNKLEVVAGPGHALPETEEPEPSPPMRTARKPLIFSLGEEIV